MVWNGFFNNINAFTKKEKMKFKLKSGKEKGYGKMTKKEKKEVDDDVVKGALIFTGVIGGMHLLDKL